MNLYNKIFIKVNNITFFSLPTVLKPVKTLVEYLTIQSELSKIWIEKDDNPILFVTGFNFDFLLGSPYNKKEYDCMNNFNTLFEKNKNFILHYYLKEEPNDKHFEILFNEENGINPKYKNRIKLRILKNINDNDKINEVSSKVKDLYDEFYTKLDKTHIIVSFSLKNNLREFYSLMVEHEHLPTRQSVDYFDFFNNFYKSKKFSTYKLIVNFIEDNEFIYKDIQINLTNSKILQKN